MNVSPVCPTRCGHFAAVRLLAVVFLSLHAHAQNADTLRTKELAPVIVEAAQLRENLKPLPATLGSWLFSGKKSEVITLAALDANLAEKTGRQLLAKVPGIFVYDLEGSNQLNVSFRGLDPHRGWEVNMRQNGILFNSDVYGYPASHYSIPIESVERLELVRGTGSLQYGAQLGGMLNYVLKQGDTTRKVSFENMSSLGSFNLLSSYNALGGKVDKVKYYAYYVRRTRDGYREQEHTDYDAQGLVVTYQPTARFSVRMQWVRSNYVYQVPGPLTEEMFRVNPRQATRSRNYYSPTIHISSADVQWQLRAGTRIQFVSSALFGQRKSVLFDRPATIPDSIATATRQYSARQVDIDQFHSFTQELRLLHRFLLGMHKHTLTAGVQRLDNLLLRRQLGRGTTATDFDLTLTDGTWGRDIQFRTYNVAPFFEARFTLTPRWHITAGARMELGRSRMRGTSPLYPLENTPVLLQRRFPMFGGGFSFQLSKETELYGGFANGYRPLVLRDVVPTSAFERVDPNLRDARGTNIELGWRGRHAFLTWDITGFALYVRNRFGIQGLTDAAGNFLAYRTNAGDSRNVGCEVLIEAGWPIGKQTSISVFTSTAFMNGRYVSGQLRAGNTNMSIAGNIIESVPAVLSRNGVTVRASRWSATGLISYTAQTFADPLNTRQPNATASVGLVPAYLLVDLNATLRLSEKMEVRLSANNLLDVDYFTKRPQLYPGPGIWPSDGRNASLSWLVRL